MDTSELRLCFVNTMPMLTESELEIIGLLECFSRSGESISI